MKTTTNYYKYAVYYVGGCGAVAGADTLEEAREIIKIAVVRDHRHGFKTTAEDYKIYRLNTKNGARVKEVR